MGILDYIILGSLLIAIGIGAWKGFLGQVLAIAGIFIIGLGTSLLSYLPEKWLSGVIKSDSVRSLVAMIITAVVLSLVYGLITIIVKKVINKVPVLGKLNRILGAVVSLVVVYMIFSILVSLVLRTSDNFLKDLKPMFKDSWIIKNVYGGVDHPERNFFGNWLLKLLQNKISSLLPTKETASAMLMLVAR